MIGILCPTIRRHPLMQRASVGDPHGVEITSSSSNSKLRKIRRLQASQTPMPRPRLQRSGNVVRVAANRENLLVAESPFKQHTDPTFPVKVVPVYTANH